jgi:hypothetical protein
MNLNIKGHRVKFHAVIHYNPVKYAGEKFALQIHFESNPNSLEIRFDDENELNAIVKYLDEMNHIQELKFIPEKETSKLVVVNA